MFDKIVRKTYSISFYMDENYGGLVPFQSLKAEKLHLKFCKHVFCVASSTPNLMVNDELGRYTIFLNIKVWVVCDWYELVFFNKIQNRHHLYLVS